MFPAFCVAVIVFLSYRLFHERRHQKKIIETLRDDITAQVRLDLVSEIRELVKDEMRLLQIVPSVDVEGPYARQDAGSPSENPGIPYTHTEGVCSLDGSAVLASVSEDTILSDAVLDNHIAGFGVEPDTVIAGGYQKSPAMESEMSLARAEQGDAPKASDDSDAVPRSESIERTLQQKGSVLLPKGVFIFEPGLTYAHFSTNRINIQGVTILDVFTIGPVSTEKIQRDILIQTMSFKYGLAHNLQGELKIPARYEFNRMSNTDGTSEDTRSKGGLGDVDVSLSRQIGWEDGWKPDLIAGLGVKSNTGEPIYNNKIALGSGHWAVRASLVAAKSSDPAVVFGSLSYTHSFKRRFENYGMIEPGGTFGYSLGTAVALSYKTAVNFSFDQSFTQKLKRNGEQVVGSFVNAANFKAGLNWAVSERASVDVSVGIGLTTDSPAFTLEMRIPVRF